MSAPATPPAHSPTPTARLSRSRLVAQYLEQGLVGHHVEPTVDGDEQVVLFVPGEVVVTPSSRAGAEERLRRLRGSWGDGSTHIAKRGRPPERGSRRRDGLVYMIDDAGAPAVEVVAELRRAGIEASLHHVVTAFPHRQGFPADDPDEDRSPLRRLDPDAAAIGAGVRVAMIDTGYPTQWFSDRQGWFTEAGRLRPDVICDLATDGDLVDDRPANLHLDFQSGHGVFAAGLVRRVAPGATLHFLKALSTDGLGTETGVARAIRTAVAGGAHVLNLSLGFYATDGRAPPRLASAVRGALDAGRAVVAAAGNDGRSEPTYPAALPGVLSVGALDGDTPAGYSNHGPWVRVWADGTEVVSEYLDGSEDPGLLAPPANGEPEPTASTFTNGQARWSGTSFACPQVAGAVAVELAQRPAGTTPRAVADELANGADQAGRRVTVRYHL